MNSVHCATVNKMHRNEDCSHESVHFEGVTYRILIV